MRRIRRHLTFANVVSVIALFIALGGTAIASLIITKNSQVDRGTISGHKPPRGDHPNIIAGSINGKDIADRSGVDTCKTPLVKKFGTICAGSDGVYRGFDSSLNRCEAYGLRLPTFSEATSLARNYDVPGVASAHDAFWTDELTNQNAGTDNGLVVVEEDGDWLITQTGQHKAVCVTDPSA